MSFFGDFERVRRLPPPVLKPFDLNPGDMVTYRAPTTNDPRLGEFNSPKFNKWKVVSISTHTFLCKNYLGIKTSFRKDDYRIGGVVRIDTKPVAE